MASWVKPTNKATNIQQATKMETALSTQPSLLEIVRETQCRLSLVGKAKGSHRKWKLVVKAGGHNEEIRIVTRKRLAETFVAGSPSWIKNQRLLEVSDVSSFESHPELAVVALQPCLEL